VAFQKRGDFIRVTNIILVILIVVVIVVLEVVLIHALVLEGLAGEIVDRTGDNLYTEYD
jgi:hypothetical protein